MSDLNLFSLKTDIKNLLFTTEKFTFNEQYSTNLWQDLPCLTPTSIFDNQISDQKNDHSQETDYDFNCESNGYCRSDHWFLLSPPPLLHTDTNQVITYYDNKRLSRDSTEYTFPDSCESLTVSVDLHVPTDDLMTDHDDQNILVWRNKIQQYTSDDMRRISRYL
jgi:hypothetical protein